MNITGEVRQMEDLLKCCTNDSGDWMSPSSRGRVSCF